MHQLHGSVKKPDTWAYSDAVIANADFCYSCWMVLNLWRTVIAVLMVFLCVCFPGPTPSSDYGSTTLPPNAAGTTFTCTTATPSTPPSSLLSGTSRSLCVDRLSWSHICFHSVWKSLRHHFSHMIFNLSIETQTKDVFFFTARDETRLRGGIYKPVNRIDFYFTRKRLCYISEQPDIQPHVSFQVKPP